MEFTGNALVVGGASGIGKTTCLAFAKAGASGLIVADPDLHFARKVAIEAKAVATNGNFRAEALHIDVTLPESIDTVMHNTVNSFGRIDYCVVCAGVGTKTSKEAAEGEIPHFINTLNVNTTGTMLVIRAASIAMRAQECNPVDPVAPEKGVTRGAIVTLGSSLPLQASPNFMPYTTSKHAVIGMTKSAAIDNIKHNIRVNCICPGWVDTRMMAEIIESVPGIEDAIKTSLPVGRVARPEEVADSILFLCGPKSSFITGCPIILDGGSTLSSDR
ncbi:hypothetical protein MGN70_006049 [Eutypa lata]|nr:hypothetical protein MGN70_006049 [Eutypa lata]